MLYSIGGVEDSWSRLSHHHKVYKEAWSILYDVTMSTKRCSKCKQVKPVSEFRVEPKHSSGYSSWCRQCCRDAGKRHRETPSGIYSNLKGRINYQLRHAGEKHRGYTYGTSKLNIARGEFIDWYEAQPKKCSYCDIPMSHLKKTGDLYNKATKRLTIDRIDNSRDYEMNNIVLACSRCNSIKSDLFTKDEMRLLAQTFIKPKWQSYIMSKLVGSKVS